MMPRCYAAHSNDRLFYPGMWLRVATTDEFSITDRALTLTKFSAGIKRRPCDSTVLLRKCWQIGTSSVGIA